VATTIRRATLADAPAIAQLHIASQRAAYRGLIPQELLDHADRAWRARDWSSRIADSAWPVLLLEDGKGPMLLGFCHLTAARDAELDGRTTGEITALHVAPGQRGRGYGRALYEEARAELARRGYTELVLWVLEGNSAARGFYETVGFRADGAKRPYAETPVHEVRYRRPV
jgi:ribosomal protein S18 acetylase RimI-like enzyme